MGVIRRLQFNQVVQFQYKFLQSLNIQVFPLFLKMNGFAQLFYNKITYKEAQDIRK